MSNSVHVPTTAAQSPLAFNFSLNLSLGPNGPVLHTTEGRMPASSPRLPFPPEPPAHLRLWSPESPADPLPLTPAQPPGDTRMSNPGVSVTEESTTAAPPPVRQRRWVLRSVFTLLLYRRKRDELAAASWYDYRTLVARWEEYWSAKEGTKGRGPDVREITDSLVREFFEAQPTWLTRRTWEKYWALFSAILTTCLVRSRSNRSGPRAEDALLTELPYLDLPSERWFKDRAKRSQAPGRKGGHQPSTEALLTLEELDAVIRASQMATFPCWDGCDPQAFWTAFFAIVSTYGPRLRDLLAFEPGVIDWKRRAVDFTEGKKLNPVWAPLAPAVEAALRQLPAGERNTLLPLPPTHLANLSRRFYPTYKTIWQWAKVPLRLPHQLRANAISRWKVHAPEWRKFVTGHSRRGDIQDQHYTVFGPEFRQAVETFPQPPALLELLANS